MNLNDGEKIIISGSHGEDMICAQGLARYFDEVHITRGTTTQIITNLNQVPSSIGGLVSSPNKAGKIHVNLNYNWDTLLQSAKDELRETFNRIFIIERSSNGFGPREV